MLVFPSAKRVTFVRGHLGCCPWSRLCGIFRALSRSARDAIGSYSDMRAPPTSPHSIKAVSYENLREPDLPVEVLSLAELRIKARPGFLSSPRRPKFHEVHVVTAGKLELEVDFERVPLDR